MRIPRFALLLFLAELSIPLVCLAQSSAVNGEPGSPVKTADRAATPVNDSTVSVQELKMSGKGETEFEKGTKLLLQGDAHGSLAYFERSLAKDPGYYRAYHNLGLAQYQLGEKSLAESSFQKAIDLTNGGYAPSHFALGLLLLQQNQYVQAEALIERGLTMDPGSGLGKYFLGLVQFALKRFSDAERSAQEALLQSADQAEAHILLAEIHEQNHNPYAVEADVAAYLRQYPHGALEGVANALLQRAQSAINQSANASR